MTEVLDRPAATDGSDGARERQDALRRQYRTLPDMDARQRAIITELAQIDQIAEPGDDDLTWQSTLIQEHDDLDAIAEQPRRRAKDLERVRKAHQDPANREEPQGTPDLVTRNFVGQDPFKEIDRVRAGLIEPRTVRGWALDAIEQASRRG